MDPNILNIQHTNVAAAKVVDKMGPLVVIQFMAQQIDVLYDTNGKVAEGSGESFNRTAYEKESAREEAARKKAAEEKAAKK